MNAVMQKLGLTPERVRELLKTSAMHSPEVMSFDMPKVERIEQHLRDAGSIDAGTLAHNLGIRVHHLGKLVSRMIAAGYPIIRSEHTKHNRTFYEWKGGK